MSIKKVFYVKPFKFSGLGEAEAVALFAIFLT